MYNRDIVLDEAQKLAKILARLLGLKSSSLIEADAFYKATLSDEFDLSDTMLLQLDNEAFDKLLNQKSFNTQKLDALAKLIYHQSAPLSFNPDTLLRLQKVIVILNLLEKQHHTQSFENIGIQSKIDKFIKEYNA